MAHGRQVLDEYELRGVLKTSVLTTVFEATDPRTGRPVIIKLITPAGPVAEEANRSRFVTAMQLAQSGTIRVLQRCIDFGFTPDHSAFLVTEVVHPAVALAGLAGEPPSRLVSILVGVLDGVDELAIAGGAHLNLSPDNVLVTDQGPRLVGFGTAAYLVGASAGVWPTDDLRYAAPELRGRGVLRRDDLWLADLYSVALMACDLLGATVRGQGTGRPSVVLPGDRPPGQFETVAAAALRGDPGSRSVSVSDLRRALVKGSFEMVEGEVARGAGPAAPDAGADAPTGAETVLVPGGTPAERWSPDDTTAVSEKTPRRAGGLPLLGGGRRMLWLAGTAVAAVVAGAIALAVLRPAGDRRPSEASAASPTVAAPTPAPTATPVPLDTPVPARHPLLDEADRLLADGDDAAARAALDGITDEEIDAFSDAEREVYGMLSDALAGTDRSAAVKDLRGGLEAGSIRMLQRGVAGVVEMTADELRAEQGLADELRRARTALGLHRELWDAHRRGDAEAVFDVARRLIAILPGYSGSFSLRDQAAAGVEAAAEAAIVRRDFTTALELLSSVERGVPGRRGVAERIRWCREQQADEARLRSVLERARAAGASGDPDAGLRLLAAERPGPGVAEEVASLREILERQAAELDREPPVITLVGEPPTSFRKNDTVVISVAVTDDRGVEDVVALLKAGADTGYREVPLEAVGGDLYRLSVPPSLHGNDRFFVFVVAHDRSGHEGSLGSITEPLIFSRKGLFR